MLTVEVAEDRSFRRVVAHAPAPVSAASDWTSRVLVGGLKPAHDLLVPLHRRRRERQPRRPHASPRPLPNDPRPVNFAFVSCQDVNEGKLNAYRRMIFEDERARPEDQLDFVLHLGDFIYEVVQYPEDGKPRYDRNVYEVARIPDALKVANFHIPTTRRGLPRSLEGLSRRSRPAGRARALAVRVHLGQSRILVAGLAEHPEEPEVRAARADDQGRRQPGLVRDIFRRA